MILFCLPFQGIRDRLYQDPMEVQTPGQAFTAFLGALGFTRPVEQLELRSVPLPSLLFWLRRPKGINLVEATMPAGEAGSTSACRSMAIAVSEEMLYKDKCPLVGVGLVYTPPYVPRVQFSVAYMNLGAWRDATEESEDRLVGTRLMFIPPRRRVNSCLLQRSIRSFWTCATRRSWATSRRACRHSH